MLRRGGKSNGNLEVLTGEVGKTRGKRCFVCSVLGFCWLLPCIHGPQSLPAVPINPEEPDIELRNPLTWVGKQGNGRGWRSTTCSLRCVFRRWALDHCTLLVTASCQIAAPILASDPPRLCLQSSAVSYGGGCNL